MTKLDLALISQLGHDRAVPKEMDLHMVKYIVGQRKTAVERAVANNDNSPFVTNRWDHSVYFTLSEHTSIDLVGIPLCILIL
jgi:ribosomal protein S9